jgi:hypothetical protein
MNDDELTTTVAVIEVTIPAMSTTGQGVGVDRRNGDTVWFAGDHRPMRELAQAVARGDEPTMELEPWQIMGRLAPGVPS